jgi:hypothetical protein
VKKDDVNNGFATLPNAPYTLIIFFFFFFTFPFTLLSIPPIHTFFE